MSNNIFLCLVNIYVPVTNNGNVPVITHILYWHSITISPNTFISWYIHAMYIRLYVVCAHINGRIKNNNHERIYV